MGRALRLGGAAAAALTLGAGTAGAAPGDLDPRFGTGGKAQVVLAGADAGAQVVLLDDGGDLIVGGSRGSSGVVARIDSPSGALDPAYGVGGWTTVGREVRALALAPGGVLLAGGSRGTGSTPFAARLIGPAWAPDGAFGTAGFTEPFGVRSGNTESIVREPGGTILLTGAVDDPVAGDRNLFATRLTATGGVDPGFAGGLGSTQIDISAETGGAGARQQDGRIVVAGASDTSAIVTRVDNPSGLFDTGFGESADGVVFVPVSPSARVSDVAIAPDGGILAAGRSTAGSADTGFVVRLRPDGTRDPAFAVGGIAVIADAGGADVDLQAVVRQPDGRVVFAGTVQAPGQLDSDFLVGRLTADGRPDTSFGSAGRARISFGVTDTAASLALSGDGTVVVVGSTEAAGADDAISVAWLQGAPTPDPPAPPGIPATPPATAPPAAAVPIRAPARAACGGRTATIVGTRGADRLRGTAKADVIAGLAGDDVIAGLGGDDVICGGAGKDVLRGGRGRDRLFGGAGRDTLGGGPGIDVLRGGPGRDTERQ